MKEISLIKKELTLLDRVQVESNAQQKKKKSDEKKDKDEYKLISLLGTIFGFVFWVYAIIQVLIYDLDRYLVVNYFPTLKFLVDYKFFIFLALITLFAIFIKRYYLLFLYVIIFPLIFIFWKIPKSIYRFKSWILVLGIIESITSFFNNLKLKIILVTIALFSFLLISISTSKPVLVFTGILLVLVLIISLARTIYLSFKPSVFFQFQSKVISKFRNSGFIKNFIRVDEKLKKNKSKKLTKAQSSLVLGNIQLALILHRGIYYWAYQLEKYRLSRVNFLLSGISYAWLFMIIVLFLGFINYAVYKIDPVAFNIAGHVSSLSFFNYSLHSLFLSEISQINARSSISTSINFLSGMGGRLLLGILFLNFIFVARQTKEDNELVKAIRQIKREGEELEKQIKSEYEVSTSEAIQKLKEIKAGLLTIILRISQELPEDYV